MSRKKGGPVNWYLPGKKRPFAKTASATGNEIWEYAQLDYTAREALQQPDWLVLTDAQAVLTGFIAGGFADVKLKDLGIQRSISILDYFHPPERLQWDGIPKFLIRRLGEPKVDPRKLASAVRQVDAAQRKARESMDRYQEKQSRRNLDELVGRLIAFGQKRDAFIAEFEKKV